MDGGATTVVVGVLGSDPLTSRILGLLLAGVGYETRVLDAAAVVADPEGALSGVDLVLLAPGAGDDREDDLLGAIKGAPKTAAIPILGLSTTLEAHPEGREDRVPWPWSMGGLARAVERAVRPPAPGGGPPT